MSRVMSYSDENYYIGGSDATTLMSGRWSELYLKKKNLSFEKYDNNPQTVSNSPQVIASKIGMCTETVNLDFLERDIEQEIFRNITVDPDDRTPWLVSSLDGMTDETHTPCEAKHTSESNTFERIASKCYPQLQHYLMHTQKDYMYLSVLFGNKKYLYAAIEADNKYQKALLDVEEWFYHHLIKNKIPTNINAYITRMGIKDKIRKLNIIDPFSCKEAC